MEPRKYSEERLRGVREVSARRKLETVQKLTAAIADLEREGKRVSVENIRLHSGLAYNSYARNPEAMKLFKEHNSFIQENPERARSGKPRRRSHGEVQLGELQKKVESLTRENTELKAENGAITARFLEQERELALLQAAKS